MGDTARAGWYRRGDQARYWDGEAWTDDVRAIPAPPPAPPESDEEDEDEPRRTAAVLMGVGAVATALGCFMPWLKATAPLMGSITVSGLDNGGDGVIVLVLAGVLGAIAYRSRDGDPKKGDKVGAAVLLVVMASIVVVEALDIRDRMAAAEAASDLISTSYGSGLVLIGMGVAAAVAGWLYMPWTAHPDR